MTFRLRALAFAILFYLMTLLWVLASLIASLASQAALHRVVRSWAATHYRLSRGVVGIDTRVIGKIPEGACLLAVKHQATFETLEIVRISNLPVMVMKQELADVPLFGKVTRLYGIIAVEREAGAKALRHMLSESKAARAAGRPVAIFPEGTRVPVGMAPPLRPGFAGMYRALGLPVVPIATDSGHFWGRGLARKSGTVTFLVGETIPAGLGREEIEARVHAAINALESAAQPRS